jgi:hypothetical protein
VLWYCGKCDGLVLHLLEEAEGVFVMLKVEELQCRVLWKGARGRFGGSVERLVLLLVLR